MRAGNMQLLVDAGISGKKAEDRLAQHGRSIREIDALLITHDHRDHAYHRIAFALPELRRFLLAELLYLDGSRAKRLPISQGFRVNPNMLRTREDN